MKNSRRLLRLALVCACLLAGACDRVVIFEPDPGGTLPDGYERIATATYTPSGAGTEYRWTYWLIGAPSETSTEEAIEQVGDRLSQQGLIERDLAKQPSLDSAWWTLEFLSEDGWVAVGDHESFVEGDLNLGPQSRQEFENSARDHEGLEIVIVSVPDS